MRRMLLCLLCLIAIHAGASTTYEKQIFLFVQVADSGSLVAKEGSAGQFVLTLNGISPQTVYFSDRPARVAGHVTTDPFLKGLGFSDKNPPNAAVEVDYAAQDEDTIVVELRHPVYNIAKSTLQYDVTILPDATGGLANYDKRRDSKLPREFSSVSVFIDDCPPATITCTNNSNLLHPCGTFQSSAAICFKVVPSAIGPVGGCTLCDYNICTEQYPQCCPTLTDCQSASQLVSGPQQPPPPPQVPPAGVIHGTVTSIAGSLWTIKGDKRTMTVTIVPSSHIFPGVKVGDKVSVMYGVSQGSTVPAIMIAPD